MLISWSVLGYGVIVIIGQALGKYMIIGYFGPLGGGIETTSYEL